MSKTNNSDHDQFYPIILSQKDYIGNSTYRYNFPLGSVSLKKSSIALESINIWYSWFNITNAFNNRIFTFAWPTGTVGYTYYQVTIDEGYYTIESLNAWFQNWMIQNGLYLIDASGNYVYMAEFLPNANYYRCQINLFNVFTSLPSGWVNPANFPFSGNLRPPLITIGDSNNFYKLIGFSPGTYSNYSNLGDLVPQMSPISNIIVQSTNLDNKYSNPSSNLHAFSVSNANFGSMLLIEPTELVFVDLTDSSVSHIDIRLVDQNYNNLAFQDTANIIKFIIKVRQ